MSQARNTKYHQTPKKGVNLGGWLTLERWITPSLFKDMQAQDEYGYLLEANSAQIERLNNFRRSFIKRSDLVWLAGHGYSLIRLPLTYGLFGDQPPFLSSVDYVDQLFKWANELGLKVLIDFHGAPGSQNGRDHSAKQGPVEWPKEANIKLTIELLVRIAKRYGQKPAFLGISLLNEPHPKISKHILLSFYQQAYEAVADNTKADTWIVFSDGYIAPRWRRELPLERFPRAVIDCHHYQAHTPLDRILSPNMQLKRTKKLLPGKIHRLAKYHPVIVGEWSLSLNQQTLANLSDQERLDLQRRYGQLQSQGFSEALASFFWTYKTESGGAWSLVDVINQGLLS